LRNVPTGVRSLAGLPTRGSFASLARQILDAADRLNAFAAASGASLLIAQRFQSAHLIAALAR